MCIVRAVLKLYGSNPAGVHFDYEYMKIQDTVSRRGEYSREIEIIFKRCVAWFDLAQMRHSNCVSDSDCVGCNRFAGPIKWF